MEVLHRWFCANKLHVNARKTKSMLFRSKQKFKANNELLLHLNHVPIEQVKCFKYLGMYLDEHLDFSDHIANVCKRVRQRTRILWKLRGSISTELARALYTSLIDPLFLYCCQLYDGCLVGDARKLQVAQNGALRAVLQAEPRSSTLDLHINTGIEWLDIRRKQVCCVETFKYTNGIGPPFLVKLFKAKEPNRALRSEERILHDIPRTRTAMGDKDFVVRSMRYWSLLPVALQREGSVACFKRNMKLHDCFEHQR